MLTAAACGVLAADVAGYSRLMGRDKPRQWDLEAHKAVILPLIAKHGGSIVNITGDGIVAQFERGARRQMRRRHQKTASMFR